MKEIYFACSIRGGRSDAELYAKLVDYIKNKATVLTEIFADNKLTADGMNAPASQIHTTDMTWVAQADAIIAEVSSPSLGVGYEIAKAEDMGKPVLALFRSSDTQKLSAMIVGSPQTTVVYYSDIAEAYAAIDNFLENL